MESGRTTFSSLENRAEPISVIDAASLSERSSKREDEISSISVDTGLGLISCRRDCDERSDEHEVISYVGGRYIRAKGLFLMKRGSMSFLSSLRSSVLLSLRSSRPSLLVRSHLDTGYFSDHRTV